MSLRELAWRVSARELEGSVEEEKGDGERAAAYLLSPFGSRMNRVLVAGELSRAEPVGREEPPTFWRSRLLDPTGSVAVTAGSFQPRAMAQLRAIDVPSLSLVVGKVHLFRGRDGVAYVSVRAEAIRKVSESEERSVLADVARQTLDRLDLLERIEHEPSVPDNELRAKGIPGPWIYAARSSLRQYPNADRATFRRELRILVRAVAGDSGPERVPPSLTAGVRVTRVLPAVSVHPSPTPSEQAEEALFLDLVDEVSESSVDGYADLKEILERIAGRGVPAERAEATLNRLEEDGAIEEPIVGKLRRA